MMTYIFSVKEINYGSVYVEANNEEEAREKAWEKYHNGGTCWGDGDVDIDFDYKEERE